MRKQLMCATALSILAAYPAVAQTSGAPTPDPVHDAGPVEDLAYRAEDVVWVDGPPSLEPGSQVAVLEGDPGAPGVFTLRLRFPDGYRISPHWHPRPERVTVVSGTFHLGHGESFDRSAAMPLGPGSYASMPPGSRHFAFAEGETVVQLTSTGPWSINYVRPEDDPRGRE